MAKNLEYLLVYSVQNKQPMIAYFRVIKQAIAICLHKRIKQMTLLFDKNRIVSKGLVIFQFLDTNLPSKMQLHFTGLRIQIFMWIVVPWAWILHNFGLKLKFLDLL